MTSSYFKHCIASTSYKISAFEMQSEPLNAEFDALIHPRSTFSYTKSLFGGSMRLPPVSHAYQAHVGAGDTDASVQTQVRITLIWTKKEQRQMSTSALQVKSIRSREQLLVWKSWSKPFNTKDTVSVLICNKIEIYSTLFIKMAQLCTSANMTVNAEISCFGWYLHNNPCPNSASMYSCRSKAIKQALLLQGPATMGSGCGLCFGCSEITGYTPTHQWIIRTTEWALTCDSTLCLCCPFDLSYLLR